MKRHAMALAILALLSPGLAGAQDARSPVGGAALRTEWTLEHTRSGSGRVVGYLYNNSSTRDAINVWLRVERLTPDGEVGGSSHNRVVGDVLSNGRLSFVVPVPEPAASYRVVVESVDWADECR